MEVTTGTIAQYLKQAKTQNIQSVLSNWFILLRLEQIHFGFKRYNFSIVFKNIAEP